MTADEGESLVVFGPVEGRLFHQSNGDYAVEFSTGVNVQDFVVSATFTNPFSSPVDLGGLGDWMWNYGYWIRISESDGTFWTFGNPFPAKVYDGLLVVLQGNGQWVLTRHTMTVAPQGINVVDTPIATGAASLVLRGQGEENRVALAAFGDRGWLTVNGSLVATLDLSLVSGPGDVRAVTGAFTQDELNLSVTDFSGLTVAEGALLPPPLGPGESLRLPTGRAEVIASGLQGDFEVSAVIRVPAPLYSGMWSWAVDVGSGDHRVRLTVDSQRRVNVVSERPQDGAIAVTTVFDGSTETVDLTANGPNNVRVVVEGDSLGFIINGQVVATARMEPGTGKTVAMTAYVRDEQATESRPIYYSEVEVWRAAVTGNQAAGDA